MKNMGDKRVFTHYFGEPIGNGQDPDEPYDTSRERTGDGMKISGKGAQGGGSKPTPQAGIMKRGSGKLMGSYPKQPQRLRG